MRALLMVAGIVGAGLVLWFAVIPQLRKPRMKPLEAGYPRLAAYAVHRVSGPLVRYGAIDTDAVKALARNDLVIMESWRTGPMYEAQRLLRQANPRLELFAFAKAGKYHVCGPGWSGGAVPAGCDTGAQNPAWARWTVMRKHSAVLQGRNGPYDAGGWIDFARPGFAEEYADTIAAWVTDQQAGAFCDETCAGILWTQGGDSIDWRAAGHMSLPAWDEAYRRGVGAFYARLRGRLGPKLLVGNGCPEGPASANGWMNENHPFQPGGSVAEYLARETTYAAPRRNWLTAWLRSGHPGDPYDRWRARYVLAVATLGTGVGAATWSADDVARGYLPTWWDEYAVSPDGRASLDLRYKGWLGRPLEPAFRQTAQVWRRNFEHGCVLVNESGAPAYVSVGVGYQRLLGVVSSDVNNAHPASTVTLPARDGLFLVKR